VNCTYNKDFFFRISHFFDVQRIIFPFSSKVIILVYFIKGVFIHASFYSSFRHIIFFIYLIMYKYIISPFFVYLRLGIFTIKKGNSNSSVIFVLSIMFYSMSRPFFFWLSWSREKKNVLREQKRKNSMRSSFFMVAESFHVPH
jgi:hypothetical protein